MSMIRDSAELAALCERLSEAREIAVDTEFIRDRTYWPKLCLVQLAGPGEAVAVDPLAEGIDLGPMFDLLVDPAVTKVFHSARQDIEIFYMLTGRIPAPLFDTQLAAMVCGFGESAGYDKLVAKLAGARIDKASQYTDWSKRPLSERQLGYALSDVIYLRVVYEKLSEQLNESGRTSWLQEEMAILTDPATYETDPAQAWRRLKTRSRDPRYLGVLKEVARWREEEAQRRDQPRGHVLRDEAIQEIAAVVPKRPEDLRNLRAVPRGMADGRRGEALVAAVKRGMELPADELPKVAAPEPLPRGLGPLVDLMKVLLKLRCEEADVAQKLVANSEDLERIAADDDALVPALRGWRREIFGNDALALKHGRMALAADQKGVRVLDLEPATKSFSRRQSPAAGGRRHAPGHQTAGRRRRP